MVSVATLAPSPVLEVRSLTVSYAARGARVSALRDVGFSIAAGETLALVGESGSGKSTMSLAIMGLLAREATVHGGSILFKGRDLQELTSAQRQALRGDQNSIVFQDPFTSLNPSLPIGLQVAEPLIFHRGMAQALALEKAVDALAEVGLPQPREIARAYPHQLSGGMQQRALIATALICDPALVILDEPTTALDVTVEAEILDLLDELRRRRSLSLLFITHNLGLVNRICDSVCVLYAGSVLEYGPTADVLRRPAHPYTKGLLSSMPRLDPAHRYARLHPIAGKFPDLTDLPAGCIFHPRCAHAEPACREIAQALVHVDPARQVRCWKWQSITDADAPGTIARQHEKAPAAHANPVGALLEVSDLTKVYSLASRLARSRLAFPATRLTLPWFRLDTPKVPAVDGVSLSIRSGETLGLVGESGCGKSTLGRCIVRLLEPSGGSIVFGGQDISHHGRRQLRSFRGLAQIVFQNPVSSLNPRKTVGAAVGRSLANFSGLAHKAARARLDQILEQVGLAASYADRYPHQLSGGERQRVGIARALATGPQFIVCDEPVSALDVSVQATVLNLLADLRDELGLSYLFISHDLAVVVHIADRIAVMYAGVLCEEGPTDAVLAPPYHPYTEILLSAIPSPDPGVKHPRIRPHAAAAGVDRPTRGCCFQNRCGRKLGRICEDTTPPMIDAAPGHRIACHIPLAELRAVPPVLPGRQSPVSGALVG
ncbi:MAG TPA: ABC transporter ATP-binding protein [Casimicrobiaceae bacterium]